MAIKTYNPKNFIVLVVDDVTENLQVLINILKKDQYKINFANSGKQAIARVKSVKPDLILLDLMMPDMDGFEVCEYLKSDENYRDIPIIFLTASHEEKHILKAFEIGAVDYVTKPFKSQELLARVKNHLELKHAKDKLKNSQNYLKKALTELVIARDKALEAERVKSQMLANTSHEIRTLMNGVLGMTELLLNTYLNEEQTDFVVTLKSSGEGLLNLINDILDFSKLESGAFKLKKAPFNLQQMLEEIYALFEGRANRKNLKLALEISPEIANNSLFIGDEFRLRQILSNLISNAIKFTDQGEVNLSVEPVKLETETNQEINPNYFNLKFTVKDTGIGISQENQTHLFKSFCQISHNMEHYYEGTGLGLAICQQLVQLMGGKIGVESEETKGSTFWFTLNLEIADQIIALNSTSNLTTQTKDQEQKYSSFSPLKILLAEDTPVNKKVIMNQLKILGHSAFWVENGQLAINQLEQEQYDLILMDCQMPVLNGYQSTQQIRQKEKEENKNKHIIIIGLTASAMEGNRQKCFDAGMDDYITKPASTNDLEALLNKWSQVIHKSEEIKEQELSLETYSATRIKHIKYPVDMERLYKFTGGDLEFQHELLLCFVSDTKVNVEEARSAIDHQDVMELLFKVHKIKGASGHVGVNLIMEITRNIEQQALSNNLESIPPKLTKIEQLLEEVETFVSSYFQVN